MRSLTYSAFLVTILVTFIEKPAFAEDVISYKSAKITALDCDKSKASVSFKYDGREMSLPLRLAPPASVVVTFEEVCGNLMNFAQSGQQITILAVPGFSETALSTQEAVGFIDVDYMRALTPVIDRETFEQLLGYIRPLGCGNADRTSFMCLYESDLTKVKYLTIRSLGHTTWFKPDRVSATDSKEVLRYKSFGGFKNLEVTSETTPQGERKLSGTVLGNDSLPSYPTFEFRE